MNRVFASNRMVLPVFIGALLLGGALRWISASGSADTSSVPPGQGNSPASASPAREFPVPTAASLMEDTRLWGKNATAKLPNPYHEELATWTDADIRAALDESLHNRDFLLDTRDARRLVAILLAEWVNRDWSAASQWFLTMPESIRSGDIASFLSFAWPPEHAAEGLAFVKANPQDFERSSTWSIAVKNIEARAQEGVASVVALLGELRDARLELSFEEPVKFPADFDFDTFMRSPEVVEMIGKGQGEFFAGAWYAQDREAFYGWVTETGALRKLPGMVALGSSNPEDGLRWLGTKYQTLAADDRETLMLGMPVGQADIMGKMIAGITDTTVAEDLRASCAEWLFAGKVMGALEILGGIRDPATRLQALEEFDAGKAGRCSPMSPGDTGILCERLKEWNATPEQINTLVDKYQRRQ